MHNDQGQETNEQRRTSRYQGDEETHKNNIYLLEKGGASYDLFGKTPTICVVQQ